MGAQPPCARKDSGAGEQACVCTRTPLTHTYVHAHMGPQSPSQVSGSSSLSQSPFQIVLHFLTLSPLEREVNLRVWTRLPRPPLLTRLLALWGAWSPRALPSARAPTGLPSCPSSGLVRTPGIWAPPGCTGLGTGRIPGEQSDWTGGLPRVPGRKRISSSGPSLPGTCPSPPFQLICPPPPRWASASDRQRLPALPSFKPGLVGLGETLLNWPHQKYPDFEPRPQRPWPPPWATGTFTCLCALLGSPPYPLFPSPDVPSQEPGPRSSLCTQLSPAAPGLRASSLSPSLPCAASSRPGPLFQLMAGAARALLLPEPWAFPDLVTLLLVNFGSSSRCSAALPPFPPLPTFPPPSLFLPLVFLCAEHFVQP